MIRSSPVPQQPTVSEDSMDHTEQAPCNEIATWESRDSEEDTPRYEDGDKRYDVRDGQVTNEAHVKDIRDAPVPSIVAQVRDDTDAFRDGGPQSRRPSQEPHEDPKTTTTERDWEFEKSEAPSSLHENHSHRNDDERRHAKVLELQLPSPSASFLDDAMQNQPWSQILGVQTMTSGDGRIQHRPSPLDHSWPQRSPPQRREHDLADDASFNLFDHSFDNLSESGTYMREMMHQVMESNVVAHNNHHHHRRDDSNGNIDIALPGLCHADFGDISPIKAFRDDTFVETRRGHRHVSSFSSSLEPLPLHFPVENPPSPHCHYPSIDEGVSDGRRSSSSSSWNQPYSNPIFVLRCSRKAFVNCTFLFSCIRHGEPCPINMSEVGSIRLYQGRSNVAHQSIGNLKDRTTAKNRVEAAICAFGGTIQLQPNPTPAKSSSIFRPKVGAQDHQDNLKKRSRHTHDERPPKKIYLSGGHVSWSVEEDTSLDFSLYSPARRQDCAYFRSESDNEDDNRDEHKSPREDPQSSAPPKDKRKRSPRNSPSPTHSVLEGSGMEPPKMKYRCKLCAQPKQNHNCPYRQSMQRSIGILVRPAVNAFAAHEPGVLTPALSEMNNFVSYDSDTGSAEPTRSQSVPSGLLRYRQTRTGVVPEALRSGEIDLSPQSSISTRGATSEHTPPHMLQYQGDQGPSGGLGRNSLKKSHADIDYVASPSVPQSPFVEAVPLRPEQYRAVTLSKYDEQSFQYPAVPLTFVARKRLSDTLYILSKEIPNITEECAALLRDARERGLWDLAVAELMTQIVVGLHCAEGDRRLDGLQLYLMSIGISC